MASYVLYLTTLLLAISTATALKCYACTGFGCNIGLLSFAYPEVECTTASTGTFIDSLANSIVPSQCVKITGKATALQCYACSGFTCSYSLLSFTYPKVDCESKSGNKLLDTVANVIPSQCVKIFGKDENGSSFVARNCTTYTSEAGCKVLAGALNIGSNLQEVDCTTCTTDLCNSAPKLSGMIIVGLIVACFAFLF